MSDPTFDELDSAGSSQGGAAAIGRLIDTLAERKEYHRLFDALLLQKRFEMGLPLARVTSLDDVPETQQEEFEEHYIAAARRIGQALLDNDNLPQAWLYFRTIREPDAVSKVLDQLDTE